MFFGIISHVEPEFDVTRLKFRDNRSFPLACIFGDIESFFAKAHAQGLLSIIGRLQVWSGLLTFRSRNDWSVITRDGLQIRPH